MTALWPTEAERLARRAQVAELEQQRRDERRALQAPPDVVERIKARWEQAERDRERFDVLVVI